MIDCITYGHHLTKEKFKPIYQSKSLEYLNKPGGGIWSSPIDSTDGWKNWCEREAFYRRPLNKYTTFSISDTLKLFILSTVFDYERLMRDYSKNSSPLSFFYVPVVDWEKLINAGYRGMWLTEKGNSILHLYSSASKRSRFSFMEVGFYGWDVETILLFYWEDLKNIKYDNSCQPSTNLILT